MQIETEEQRAHILEIIFKAKYIYSRNVESLIWRVLGCKPGSSSFALWPMDIDPRVHAFMPKKTNDIVEFEIGDL